MLNNSEKELLCCMLCDIGEQYSTVYEIGYFGSYAKNTMNEKSDFDIVLFCHGYSEKSLILSELLSLIKKFKILIHPIIYDKSKEVVSKNKFIKNNIIDNEIVVYTNNWWATIEAALFNIKKI